jgi:hypothetical protein
MELEQKISRMMATRQSVQDKIDKGAHNELCLQEIADCLTFGLESLIGRNTYEEAMMLPLLKASADIINKIKPEPQEEEVVAKVTKKKAAKKTAKKKTAKKSKK